MSSPIISIAQKPRQTDPSGGSQGSPAQLDAPEAPKSPVRQFLMSRSSGKAADTTFSAIMLMCALSIFAIVLFILYILIARSKLSISQFGFKFFTRSAWDPVYLQSLSCWAR